MTNDKKPVYVIGDTPTAFYLAAQLTLENENVRLLASGLEEPSASLLLNDLSTQQKRTASIKTTSLMREPASAVLLCMAPEKINSGLTYISAPKTLGCPVVSFCHTAETDFINRLLKRVVIPAYFDGWFQTSKENEITFLGCSKGITVSLDENHQHHSVLQKILAKSYVKTTCNPDNNKNFWNYFIPYAACSLFSLQNGPQLRNIAQKSDLRQFMNTLIDELIFLAPEELDINKEQMISGLYQTPNNYHFPILNAIKNKKSGELNFIFDILKTSTKYTKQTTPETYTIIRETFAKLFSDVEE